MNLKGEPEQPASGGQWTIAPQLMGPLCGWYSRNHGAFYTEQEIKSQMRNPCKDLHSDQEVEPRTQLEVEAAQSPWATEDCPEEGVQSLVLARVPFSLQVMRREPVQDSMFFYKDNRRFQHQRNSLTTAMVGTTTLSQCPDSYACFQGRRR